MKNAFPLLLTAGAIYWLATRKKTVLPAPAQTLTRLSGTATDPGFEPPAPLTPTYVEVSEKKEVEDVQTDIPVFANLLGGASKENSEPTYNSAL